MDTVWFIRSTHLHVGLFHLFHGLLHPALPVLDLLCPLLNDEPGHHEFRLGRAQSQLGDVLVVEAVLQEVEVDQFMLCKKNRVVTELCRRLSLPDRYLYQSA